jgi:hypothetical protein
VPFEIESNADLSATTNYEDNAMKDGSTHTRWSAHTLATQLLLVFVFLALSWTSAKAQNAEELAEQQMQIMKQYMEASGMSENEMADAEAMFKDAMNPIVEKQAAEESKAAAEFESQTSGLGKASVSILGEEIEMRITRCETGKDGNFFVEAKKGTDRRKGHLTLRGNSHYNRTEAHLLSPGIGLYEVYISPIAMPEDGQFSWTGMAEGDRGPAELTIDLNCADGS